MAVKRVSLIIGGSGALGRAFAHDLARDHTVVIADVDTDRLYEAAKETGCDPIICDITNWESVKNAVNSVAEKYGNIDILINCAGLYASGPIEDIDPEHTSQVFAVNAVGPLYVCKAVVPHMKNQNGGLIVNVNSIGGVTTKANRSVYYGSKWGLSGISKNLQTELSPFGIRITELHPAALESSMHGSSVQHSEQNSVRHKDMVDTLRFIISRPRNLHITTIGIKHINY